MCSRRLLLLVSATALAAGCGGEPGSSAPRQAPKASPVAAGPYELTCRDLRAPAASRRAVGYVTDVLVAPAGHPRRETRAIVRKSLRDTCALPSLPGVDDPADYRPMRPIRRAVQSHFDQDVIYGR